MGLIIGLHGAKGSGKDAFYKIVKQSFPDRDVRKIAYADPIKQEVCRIFDLDPNTEQQYDLFKRTDVNYQLPGYLGHGVAGRQVVREIGMLMRRYDENQFTRYVEDTINSSSAAIWCITDLRFTNELDSIKNRLGGIVIKIKRANFDYDGHATETELADSLCDSIINNNTTLDDYQQSVVSEITSILQTLSIIKER